MKKLFTFLFIILSFLFFVVGCSSPETCEDDDLVAPMFVDPPMWGIVSSLTPTLTWEYPASNVGGGCQPEQYRITLQTGPFFEDDLGGTTTEGKTSWIPTEALQPGTIYTWKVEAMIGDLVGPSSGDNFFITGPTCAPDSLVAPVPLRPEDGVTLDHDWPLWIWDYPEDCTPTGYRIFLSTTPDFSDTSLFGWQWFADPRWGPGQPLDDCETYYWKVAAINGDSPDYTLGPESMTVSFRIDVTGSCPYPFPYDWPIYHVKVPSICRLGPSQEYNIMDYLEEGDARQAEGRNEDGSWVLLRLDDNRRCWVSINNGDLDGDINQLPVEIAAPIPLLESTESPEPEIICSTFDQSTCEQNSTWCEWVINPLGPSYCRNR